MIITNDFILLNFPKTGSTFARQVITDLYTPGNIKRRVINKLLVYSGLAEHSLCIELMLPRTEFRDGYNHGVDQHGRYEQVPEKYLDKPVLSIVRDPVIRNISFYEYGWWKKQPVASRDEILRVFPEYPDLDFESYLKYQVFNTQFRDTGVTVSDDIGNQTVHFIQFFSKNPRTVFRSLCDDYIFSGEYRNDFPQMTLLKSENLNLELHDYLLGCGFETKQLEFFIEKQPVRPEETERFSDFERKKLLTGETIERIRWRERYLYRIYEDYGIVY